MQSLYIFIILFIDDFSKSVFFNQNFLKFFFLDILKCPIFIFQGKVLKVKIEKRFAVKCSDYDFLRKILTAYFFLLFCQIGLAFFVLLNIATVATEKCHTEIYSCEICAFTCNKSNYSKHLLTKT